MTAPVTGEIEVRLPDQRPHELGLARRRQPELGGLARLVLEQPGKHFAVLGGQPDGDDFSEHVITCIRTEYTSIRDPPGRRIGSHRMGISQDLH